MKGLDLKKSYLELEEEFKREFEEYQKDLENQKHNILIAKQKKHKEKSSEELISKKSNLIRRKRQLDINFLALSKAAARDHNVHVDFPTQSSPFTAKIDISIGSEEEHQENTPVIIEKRLKSYQQKLKEFSASLQEQDEHLELLQLNEKFLDQIIKLGRDGVNFQEIESCLKKGANVNFSNEQGTSALHFAVRFQNIRLIEFLLSQKGVSVDYVSENDDDPGIKGFIRKDLQEFSGFSNQHPGIFEPARAAMEYKALGQKPFEVSFATGNTDIVLLFTLKGVNVSTLIMEEKDNGVAGKDPRRSPLILIAPLREGTIYKRSHIIELQKKFGTNLINESDSREVSPKGSQKTHEQSSSQREIEYSSKVWATRLILQQMSPHDVEKDLRYFLDNDRQKDAEFIIPLARKHFLIDESLLEKFKDRQWNIGDSPSSSGRKSFTFHSPLSSSSFSSLFRSNTKETEKEGNESGVGHHRRQSIVDRLFRPRAKSTETLPHLELPPLETTLDLRTTFNAGSLLGDSSVQSRKPSTALGTNLLRDQTTKLKEESKERAQD